MIDITMVIDVIIRDYSDPPHLQLLVDNMCRILHSTLSMPMQADSCHPLLSQLHGLVHGTQPLFILGRALGHPVLRPEGPAEVGTERTAADRYHLADDIEVVDGLEWLSPGRLYGRRPLPGLHPPCYAGCRGLLPSRPGSGPAWSWSERSGCPGTQGCR